MSNIQQENLKEIARLRAVMDLHSNALHPEYGICDEMGTNGLCAECERLGKYADTVAPDVGAALEAVDRLYDRTATARDLHAVRDTLHVLAAERDRWKQKAEAFEAALGREVKRTMSEEAKVLLEENDALYAQLQEAKEALQGEFSYEVDGDRAFMPRESARKLMKAIGDAYRYLDGGER